MKRSLLLLLTILGCAFYAPAQSITGNSHVCVGSQLQLSNTAAGTWTSSNTSLATINSSGTLTGVAAGVDTIIYSYNAGGSTYKIITIDALPPADYSVTPAATLCFGTRATFVLALETRCALYGLSFNGTNSVGLRAIPILTATDNITIEAKVIWNGGGDEYIFLNGGSTSDGYGLMVQHTSGSLALVLGGVGVCTSSAKLTAGKVHGVAIVRNAGTWSIYVDGVQYAVTSATSAPIAPATGFSLGASETGGKVFNGRINNVAFWTTARSTTQITADMACISPQGNLACYWKCDVAGGTSVPDISGNNRLLQLSNVDWVSFGASSNGYLWRYGDGFTSTDPETYRDYTAAGIYSSSLKVTSEQGCINTTTVVVTMTAYPNAGTIVGNDQVCAGGSIALTNAVAGGVWTSNNPSIASVSSSGFVQTGIAGTAWIYYTVTTSPATGSCSSATAIQISSNPNPDPSYAIGADSVCARGAVPFVVASGAQCSQYGVTFNGSSSTGIKLLPISTAIDNITIEAKIIWNGSINRLVFINGMDNLNGYGLFVTTGGALAVRINNGTLLTSAAVLTQGKVHNVALVRSAGTWWIYLEGIRYAVTSPTTAPITPTYSFCLGSGQNGYTFDGTITSIAFWTTARNKAEIVQDMGCIATPQANLAAYWKCNEVSGDQLFDASGNGNTISLSGVPFSQFGIAVADYAWTFGDGTTGTGATTMHTYTTAGTYTSTLTCTTVHGCVSSTTASVTVKPAPDAGTILGNTTVCQGQTSALTNAVAGGLWTTSNSTVAPVSITGAVNGLSGGTATISYTIAGPATPGSCTSSSAVAAIIIEKPSAYHTVSPGTGCAGSPVSFIPVTEQWCSNYNANFNGTNSSMSRTTAITVATDNITLEAKIKWSGNGSDQLVFMNGHAGANGYGLLIKRGSGSLQILMGGVLIATSSAAVTDGVVQHVAIVRNAGVWSVYVDGVQYSVTFASVGPLPANAANSRFVIGADASGSSPFSGVIGSVAFWSVARSSSQIQQDMTGCISAPQTGLLGYWNFSGGPGSTVADASGNGKTLTANNITWTQTEPYQRTFLWSYGDGTTDTASNASHIYSVSGVYSSSLTVTTAAGCSASESKIVAVDAAAGIITGNRDICMGETLPLSNSASGGVWISSNTTVATIAANGTVYSATAGNTVISYTMNNACGVTSNTISVSVAAPASAGNIAGNLAVCTGLTTMLSNTTGGGAWSSGNTSVATVSVNGTVYGVTAGSAAISYVISNACGTAVNTATVSAVAPASAGTITGTLAACAGQTTSLTNTVSGGAWSSSNTTIATISTNGTVYGLAAGNTTISYTITNACSTVRSTAGVTVSVLNLGSISGNPVVCTGLTTSLSNSTGAGVWSSDNTTIATVSATGTVYGVSAGSAVISYTISNACGTAANTATVSVVAPASAGTITGTLAACAGQTTSLTNTVSGGAWSSGNTTIATVSVTGTVYGLSAGNTTISYTITNACGTVRSTAGVTVSVLNPGSISGNPVVCTGLTTSLSNSMGGGVWSSDNTAIATVSATGTVYGVSAGSAVISYTISNACGTAANTTTVSVNASADAGTITGTLAACAGQTTSLTNTVSGGAWSSSNTTIATVSAIGTVYGLAAGSATISYVVTNTCGTARSTAVVTFFVLNAGSITGALVTCPGQTTSLTNTVSGGTWSSSNTAIATVSAIGTVYGVATGSTTISYGVTNVCGTVYSTTDVTVPAMTAGSITGNLLVCAGQTTSLSSTVSGGAWSSGNTSVATISPGGVVYGRTVGTATITYTIAGACTTYTTNTVTVKAASFLGTVPIACINVPVTYATQAGETNYVWSATGTSGIDYIVNSGGTTASSSMTLTWLSEGTRTVSVTYTGGPGCTTNPASTTTTVEKANADFSTSISSVCVGTSMFFVPQAEYWCGSYALNCSQATSVAQRNVPISTTIDNITIEASVVWNGGSNQVIFLNGNLGGSGYSLMVSGSDGSLAILLGGITGLQSSAKLTTGVARNVAIVRNAGTWSVYMDGVQYAVTNPGTVPNTPETGFFVGNSSSGVNAFNGRIGNVKFWTVARSAAEILSDMGCITTPQAGLAGYWKFNEGTGTSASDVSGNGRTLTMSNAAWVGVQVPATSYVWNFGDGATETSAKPTHTYAVSSSYTPSLTVTTASGCISTSTVQVTAVEPISTAGAISGATAVCVGHSISLTNTVAEGTWSSGSNSIATVDAAGRVYGVSPGTSVISYRVTNVCNSVNTTASVTVNAAPAVSFIASSSISCLNVPVTYATQAGQENYTWTLPGSVLGTDYTIASGGGAADNSVGLTWLTPGSRTVKVNYTNSAGCDAVTAAAAATVIKEPVQGYTVTQGNLCPDVPITFNSDPTLSDTWCSAYIYKSGTGNIVRMASPVSTLVNNITIEATVVWEGGTGFHVICSNGQRSANGYCLELTTAGALLLRIGSQVLTSGFTLTVGQVYHVAAVRSSNQWRVYLNGVQSASSISTTPETPAGGFYIGNGHTNLQPFRGTIGSVKFWSVARSANDILNDTGCITTPQSGLIGYWKFSEGSGTTVSDASGNGNTLTMTTASWAGLPAAGDYIWNYGNGSTSNAVSPSYAYTVGGTYSTSVSVSYLGCTTVRTRTVTIASAADPGNIAGAASVCLASSVQLSNNVMGGTWGSSNTAVATIGADGQVYSVAAGSANISYTATNACGGNTTVKTLMVPAAFTPSLTNMPEAGICHNTPVTYSMPAGQSSYAWTVPGSEGTDYHIVSGGTGPTDSTVTMEWLTGGNKTMTINYSSIYGCAGTMATSTTTSVNPGPLAPADITGPVTVCRGSSVRLSSATGGGLWYSLNNSVATVTSTGLVSGVNNGTATILYNVFNVCGTNVAFANITVGDGPGSISGDNIVCAGGTLSLSNSSAGGAWTSSNTSIATVGSDGTATGVSSGIAVISYTVGGGCQATKTITVTPGGSIAPISGASIVCVLSTTSLSNSTSGGAWSSSNTAVAIAGASGVVTGVSAGTATISYTVATGCGTVSAAHDVTVTALPDAGTISGASDVCALSSVVLSSNVSGGTWSSGNTAIATVSTTGVVTGAAAGVAIISYTITNSCASATATKDVTVGALPVAGSVSGPSIVCSASFASLSSELGGGVWSSSSTTVATVDAAGTVTGVAAGGVTISYQATNSCGTATAVHSMTVMTTPNAGTITGAGVVAVGSSVTLSNEVSGGIWSATNTNATISGRTVTGQSAGVVDISYSVANSCGTTAAVKTMTVTASGAITGGMSLCAGATTALVYTAGSGGTWTSSNAGIATVGAASGIVTGVAAGTARITYTLPAGGGIATATVTVNALSATTGGTTVCQGQTTALSNSTAGGGAWSSSNTAIATVSTSGMVTGAAAGTVAIYFTTGAGCIATRSVTVSTGVVLTGLTSVCTGQTTVLSNNIAGGIWNSSSAAVATVTASGIVGGAGAGVVRISYTAPGGCLGVATITVGSLQQTTGTASACAGQSLTLTNNTPGGGVWSSSNTAIVVVNSSGIVSGTGGGTAVISFTTPGGCVATKTVTISNTATITGNMSVCVGQTTPLSNSISGGNWSTSSGSFANVSASGVVTGVGAGTVKVFYILPSGCQGTATMTVHALQATTGGTNGMCSAGSQTLVNNTPGGGVWTSSNTGAATVSSAGLVKGTGAGVTVISFIVNGSGCVATRTITVNACRESRLTETTPLEVPQMDDVRLFPNPNRGMFTVNGTLVSVADKEVVLEVVNMLGQVIYMGTAKTNNSVVNEQVALPGNPANGMYLLNIRGSGWTKMLHFVVAQ